MFDHDRSATRGEMKLCGLYVFSHPDALGMASAASLTSRLTLTRTNQHKAPCRHADYQRTLDSSPLPAGIQMTTFGRPLVVVQRQRGARSTGPGRTVRLADPGVTQWCHTGGSGSSRAAARRVMSETGFDGSSAARRLPTTNRTNFWHATGTPQQGDGVGGLDRIVCPSGGHRLHFHRRHAPECLSFGDLSRRRPAMPSRLNGASHRPSPRSGSTDR